MVGSSTPITALPSRNLPPKTTPSPPASVWRWLEATCWLRIPTAPWKKCFRSARSSPRPKRRDFYLLTTNHQRPHHSFSPRIGEIIPTEEALMRPVIAFDLNGTLLDLSALDPYFLRTFGDTEARREWFIEVIQSAMVATITGSFVDFPTLGKNALEVLAGRRSAMLGSEEKIELLQNLRQLPPFADVAPAL